MFRLDRVMDGSLGWWPPLSAVFISLMIGVAWFVPNSAPALAASPQDIEQIAQTTSYRIKVRIGLKVTMAMSTMTMVDQGQPVNRHLEVHIFDKQSGANVKSVVPIVTITNQATRTSRRLANVEACLTAKHREIEPHYGDNLYLPDGTYTVTVGVGQETAVFRDVAVK